MALKKQARELSKKDIKNCLKYLEGTKKPTRNKVIFGLSVYSGLRAVEISKLEWAFILGPNGKVSNKISIQNKASKGKSGGRIVPMAPELRAAILQLAKQRNDFTGYVITSQKGGHLASSAVQKIMASWYKDLGLVGCSSHSGRITFANTLRRAGVPIDQIQYYMGHTDIKITMVYLKNDSYGSDSRAVRGLYNRPVSFKKFVDFFNVFI